MGPRLDVDEDGMVFRLMCVTVECLPMWMLLPFFSLSCVCFFQLYAFILLTSTLVPGIIFF